MKKLLPFVFFVVTACSVHAQNYWIQLDSIKGPARSVASAFAISGEGYVLCGLESTGFMRKMYSYDIGQNDWDDEQSLGGLNGGGLSRGSACAFSIYNKGYICLGQGDNTNYLDDVWEYDPALDVWSQKADYGGSARRAAVSFVIGGYAYVGTGQDAGGLCDDFYKYDPLANSWIAIADFGGTPRKYAAGFSMGNQGYVGTGDDGTLRNDFWQYQASANTWIQKANFPGTVRSGAVAWGYFPNGYIATGEDVGYNYCNDVWQYNYFTNQWTARAALPGSGRKHAIAFSIGNVAYVGAGYNGALLDDFYSYQGVTGIADERMNIAPVIYPNPSNGIFSLTSDVITLSDCSVTVTDARGRDVTDAFAIVQNAHEVRLHAVSAGPALYYVSVYDQETSLSGTTSVIIE